MEKVTLALSPNATWVVPVLSLGAGGDGVGDQVSEIRQGLVRTAS